MSVFPFLQKPVQSNIEELWYTSTIFWQDQAMLTEGGWIAVDRSIREAVGHNLIQCSSTCKERAEHARPHHILCTKSNVRNYM